jgi:hypothetical protein
VNSPDITPLDVETSATEKSSTKAPQPSNTMHTTSSVATPILPAGTSTADPIEVEEGEVAPSRPPKRRRETVCVSYLDPLLDLDLTSPSFLKLSNLPTFSVMSRQFTMPSLPNQLPDTLSRVSLRPDLTYGPHVKRSFKSQINSVSPFKFFFFLSCP